MGIFFLALLLTVLCTRSSFGIIEKHRSSASFDAFKKFLDDTCQTEKLTDSDFYWKWELHEFLTSLRVQLLPSTADGDLTDFVHSPLIRYLPTSPLDKDPRRQRCQREKKNRNLTESLNSKAELSSDFQDYIIDLLFPGPSHNQTLKESKLESLYLYGPPEFVN